MDSTDLSPNPIVFFASFLILLTYICNKFNQQRAKTPEENNFHEYYSLQEHYVPHAPHVQTTIAQELPRIFEEQPRKAYPRNGFMNHHEEKDLVNNYIPYRPVARPPQDESLSQDDGWTAREPEFGLTDVSAIHPMSRTKGPSADNSLLDYPIFEPRGGEHGYVEFQQEMLIEENIAGVDSKKKTTTTKLVQRRREVIYQESSESDNERSLSQKGNNRNNQRNGVVNNVRKDESIGNRKRQIEFEDSSYQNMNDTYSRDTKGFLDYEPGVAKKSQQHEIRATIPNGKITKVTEEPLVKVKEVFDLPSRNSSKRKALDKDSKNSGSLKTTKHSEGATTDEDASKKKVGKPLERGRSSNQDSDVASRKELLRKQSPLDLSYLGEYGTNQSLKKYVAKKTVQEQAFRGTGYASDETSKKTLADLAAPKIVQQSAGGSNTGLFAKPAEGASGSGTGGGSGLFKSDGAGASSGTGQSASSSLFGNLNKPAADSGSQSTAATATESKSSGLFGPAGGATESKSSGLFGNIAEKKAEAAAQKPADNAQKPTDTSKSLFGNSAPSGGSGSASGSSSLFGPGAISSNAQKTQAPTNPAPAAANTTTTASSLFGQPATTTENKGLPRVNASEDLTKPPQTETKPGGLFANLNSAANTGNASSGLGSLVNPTEKKELLSSIFGGSQSQAAPEQKPNPPPQENKPAGGLFATITSSNNAQNKPPSQPISSLFSQSPSKSAEISEPKKDEQPKSSLFGGLTNSSSGLFGGSKPEPPKEPAPQQVNTQQGSAESPPPKAGMLASFGMNNNTSPQTGGGGGSFAGLFAGNKPPGGGSINPNVATSGDAAPVKNSLFGGGGLSKPEGGSSTGSGLFGSNKPSGGSGLAIFNSNNNNNSPTKPAEESSGGGTGSLFSGNNNASAQSGNKSSGLLGLLGNNAGGGNNSGGMFANVNSGSSGSSLFGNNNNSNNANNSGGGSVGGLNALLFAKK